MLTKFVVISILVVVILSLQTVVSTVIQPEVSTSLALEQFADPSVAVDSVSRLMDRITSRVLAGSWILLGIGSALWLRKDLLNYFKNRK